MSLPRAKSKYKMFHGRNVKSVKQTNFHVPEYLIYLGEAVEIVYRSDKFHGGGDGKTAEYIHEFSKGTKLFMDERTGKMLYIHGSKLIVTDAGIEN